MADRLSDAVIRFEGDGYDLNQTWLLGRHVAGNGFLRAAVHGRGEGPVYGYTPFQGSAKLFGRLVREMDAAAEPVWIKGDTVDHIGQKRGVLYIGDPAFSMHARLRLRVGVERHSLCGVTHTLATGRTMQELTELITEAVMPWDALICTSQAALETVRVVLDAQADYLRWRLGDQVRIALPQTPVIPLGVHCSDFAFTEAERRAARASLGFTDQDVVALYVGRITHSSKAHPFPIFEGLSRAAERTGQSLVFLQCGEAPTEGLAAAFATGAEAFAPGVRTVKVGSRDDASRRNAWAAADLFLSFSDSIQETFGLTPIEAMAAGLPVVVSDWNGYRDTVRNRIDGFRIASWAPGRGQAGEAFATLQEAGSIRYDAYCWAAASATSVDLAALSDRLTELVSNPDLRRTMGAAGRERARTVYDWAHVFRQYRALWGELDAQRLAAADDAGLMALARAAPKAAPSRLDPFQSFAHYPTHLVTPETVVSLAPGATLDIFRERVKHPLFNATRAPERFVVPMWSELEKGEASIAGLAAVSGLTDDWAVIVCGTLAKMGLARLR